MQVSQAQHHSWWFRKKVQILSSKCQTMTYSLADWQLKTKMDWSNSTLAGKVNSLKRHLQFNVHEMVSVFSPLTLLQWSTFSPLLIITLQSVLPVHLVLDLFVLQNCCCRHFRSIRCSCPDPQGSPSLQHAPTTSLFEFCILLHAQIPPEGLCFAPPPPSPQPEGLTSLRTFPSCLRPRSRLCCLGCDPARQVKVCTLVSFSNLCITLIYNLLFPCACSLCVTQCSSKLIK